MSVHPLFNNRIKSFLKNNIQRNFYFQKDHIHLHANENGLGSPLLKWYNRFTNSEDIVDIRSTIGGIKKVSIENIFLSSGHYSIMDIFIRCFCETGKDNIIFCSPTPQEIMQLALFNEINFHSVPLNENQQLDMIHLENIVDENSKMLWLSSPNHFTGNNMLHEDIEMILNNFPGLVIVDEAYINFAKQKSLLSELNEYPNLIVCQNFNHAWGLAGLEIEMAFADPEIISVLNELPFAKMLPKPSLDILQSALTKVDEVNMNIKTIVAMRKALARELQHFPFIENIFTSEANFLLIKFKNAQNMKSFLHENKIDVYDLSAEKFYENCLRVSIGTEIELKKLMDVLEKYTVDI